MNKLTDEELEELVVRSAMNMGAAEKMWIPDPDTGDMIFVDMKKPSDEALILLHKLFGGNSR